MKTGLRILSLTALGIASFATLVLADTVTHASTPAARQSTDGFKENHDKKMAARAALLGLTDTQQTRIKSIVTASREANAPLRLKLADNRKQIRELSRAVPFDEAAVRALIAGGESLRTELAISRIKVRNQIQTVLTPEQQAKAQQLRQLSPNKHRVLHRDGEM